MARSSGLRRRSLRPMSYVIAGAAMSLAVAPADAQEALGHKLPGTLGLDAGSVSNPGVYVVETMASYRSRDVVDRNGNRLPLNLDLAATAGLFGLAATVELLPLATYFTVAVGIPAARIDTTSTDPLVSLDRFGFADLFVQPVKLGWRLGRVELVLAYAFYAPTAASEPGGNDGIGRGQWTHEGSTGGTLYFDHAKTWSLSALTSYERNQRKESIDITRGDTLQVQGGAGKTLLGILDVGLVGYALWQVTDDSGSRLPPALRGARDRTYGLGPELGVDVAPLRSRLAARYEHDFAVESRPRGQIWVIEWTVLVYGKPRR